MVASKTDMPTLDWDQIAADFNNGHDLTPVENQPDEVRWYRNQKTRFCYYMTEGGSYVLQARPVANSIEEARDKLWDFYHHEVGWVKEGYKVQTDRTVKSILSDSSLGGEGRFNL